jgi:hypothetical protein
MEGLQVEGEREFDIAIQFPEDISSPVYEILGDYISENAESTTNYFHELLELKRAAFMIEIAAPIEIIHQAESLLTAAGYHTLLSLGFDVCDEIIDDLNKKYPDDIIVAASLYVSLHEGFIEVARLLDAGIIYPIISGLLYRYKVKNIIGFVEQGN